MLESSNFIILASSILLFKKKLQNVFDGSEKAKELFADAAF